MQKNSLQKHTFRVIEFIFCDPLQHDVTLAGKYPLLGLFKLEEIVSITQIDENFANLTLITGQQYRLLGKSRTLHNRFLYALEKEGNLYYDSIIRPTSAIYHNPLILEADGIFMDSLQLAAFFKVTNPELLNNVAIQNKINNLESK